MYRLTPKNYQLLVLAYINQMDRQFLLYTTVPAPIYTLVQNYYLHPDERLYYACCAGNLSEADQALKQSANYKSTIPLVLGQTSMMILCAMNGFVDIAQLLIEYNNMDRDKMINKRLEFDGATPLHHAAANNQPEFCDFLLSNGSQINARDKIGRTAMMEAANIGSLKCLQILLNQCQAPDVNAEDRYHHTALSYCIDAYLFSEEQKCLDCAMYLVENGANPNYPGILFDNIVLLHCVAANGDLDSVIGLVERYKAAVRVYSYGMLPIDYAKKHNHMQVVEYLSPVGDNNLTVDQLCYCFNCFMCCIAILLVGILLVTHSIDCSEVVALSVGIILIVLGTICCFAMSVLILNKKQKCLYC